MRVAGEVKVIMATLGGIAGVGNRMAFAFSPISTRLTKYARLIHHSGGIFTRWPVIRRRIDVMT